MEDITSLAAAAIGILFIYKSRQRRFERTNQFGIEAFPSYFSKLKSRLWDETLFVLGMLTLCYGTLSLGFKYAEDMFSLLVLVLAGVVIEHILLNNRRKLNHVKKIE